LLEGGWGYDQDLPGAEAWYRVAADRGSARGSYGLGLARIRMGRCKDAIDPLEHAISQGYPPAYSALANVYSRGVDVPRDRRRALSLWQTGASLGHLDSLRGLVWALLHGYAGIRGRIEGLSKLVPTACQVVRARREPIMLGSGDFHRVS
jgi:TPR repeat protein